MLIEFSVSNFCSFRERQTFQMTAAPRLGKKENVFAADVDGEKLPGLLKVAAIYGPNASGKTSFIRALAAISRLAGIIPSAQGKPLPVRPFRFDPDLTDKPSTFELHFVVEKLRYQFLVSATAERIVEEVLKCYPRGKETLLYSRQFVSGGDQYTFGERLEADKIVRTAWSKLTGPKSLFISQAVANSSEQMQQLRKPFSWLTHGMFVITDDFDRLSEIGRRIPRDDHWSERMSSFLQDIDIPITDIRFEPSSGEESVRQSKESVGETSLGDEGKTTLTHHTRLDSAKFDFSEESRGTQNLVGFFLPYMAVSSADKDSGIVRVLVIDEFDSSLHPEAVEHLVNKHVHSGVSTQIIFTTHDTHLMSTRLMRRDQFWLTDRNSSGATRLRSIHSFEGREGEDLEKRYFEGRYRGLPIRRGK